MMTNSPKLMKTLIVVLLLSFSIPSIAGGACAGGVAVQAEVDEFFVSGVLRRNGDDITIKLVHSVEKAQTKDGAIDVFASKVSEEYPGYSIIDTLASRAQPSAPTFDCHYPPAIKGIAI